MTTTVSSPRGARGREQPASAFPSTGFPDGGSYAAAYFDTLSRACRSVDPVQLQRAAVTLLDAYTGGHRVFSCGNGGSAAIADHLHCDHLKGVRTGTDLVPRVISLSSNGALLTAIANDIGFEDVFVYQLESHGQAGDVLVTISSSGRSPNIVRAIAWARDHDMATIALTGFDGGNARRLADVSVHVDCANYGIVEDAHQAAMHALAQYIRHSRIPDRLLATTTF